MIHVVTPDFFLQTTLWTTTGVACRSKMVSFVCDGCGDVVKKPKLQQHYNRCYSPFTCLDCSVQFLTPKDAHSSCITEDEKYQKRCVRFMLPNASSLYKGKKNVCIERLVYILTE